MATIRVLKYTSSLDTTAFLSGIRQIDGYADRIAKEAGRKLDMTAHIGKTTSALSSLTKGALAGAAAFAAYEGIGKVFDTIAEGIKGASDLNESLSKTDVILGSASGGVKKFADDMAERFGSVKSTTLDLASEIGGLGRSLGGLEGDKLAAFTNQFTMLAADVSSIKNIDMKAAGDALRVGLSGEQSDVLKGMGVILTETTVKAYAAAHGIGTMGHALTESEKFSARAGLTLEKLKFAQGDLERTITGPANAYRKFTGTMQNFATEVGTSLLPAVGKSLTLLNDLATAGRDLFKGWKPALDQMVKDWGESFDVMGVVTRNWQSSVELMQIAVGTPILNIGEDFRAVGLNIVQTFEWAFGQVGNMARDAAAATGVAFKNLFKMNMNGLVDTIGLGRVVADRPKGVLDGFKPRTVQPPRAIMPRHHDPAALGAVAQGRINRAEAKPAPPAAKGLLGSTFDSLRGLVAGRLQPIAAMASGLAEKLGKDREALADFAKDAVNGAKTSMEVYAESVGKLNRAFINGDVNARQLDAAIDDLFKKSDVGQIFESMVKPMDAMRREADKLTKAYDDGIISADLARRGIEHLFKQSEVGQMVEAARGPIAKMHEEMNKLRDSYYRGEVNTKDFKATKADLVKNSPIGQLMESVKTPAMQFQKSIGMIRQSLLNGDITQSEAFLASKGAYKDSGLADKDAQAREVKFAGAAELGSAEAYSSIIKAQAMAGGANAGGYEQKSLGLYQRMANALDNIDRSNHDIAGQRGARPFKPR